MHIITNLIFCYFGEVLENLWKNGSQNQLLHQMLLQNRWKSSSEDVKIHSKSSFKAILLQRRPSNLNFFENLWFFNDFWLPKRSQNPRKNAENAMLKNNAFCNRILMECSSLWPPKMDPKFNGFRIFIEKLWFFNDFKPPKRSQNRRKNAENTMLQNNTFLHRFLLDFSSLWPPQIERKVVVFPIFIDKADFVKIIVFP